ncbi:hypothetical protein Strvi_3319 [Streptomyces violaceusniger Tu 4113]|uniref:Uncharacterized protein n=1 Tax=Streptomyces violaceusniger (strain Tu 4113) TaxID=653045 RepID=G2P3D0_STRV4|nr:hypothetical protein Strvi_3319 [Streptomyces violaceusniger Tu 4113]
MGVELVPATETEDALRVLDVHVERTNPFDAFGKPIHEGALEHGVSPWIVLVHDVVARRGPRVTRDARGTAGVRGDLHDHDGQTIANGTGTGGQPRHTRTDDQQVHILHAHVTPLRR